jgi:hypothetical protein
MDMNRYIFRLTLLGGLIFFVCGLALLYNLPLDTRDPSPRQPLPFSHQLHAGDYQIDCRFCHRHVEAGPVAGIPDLALCRVCHLHIATENPAIMQLMAFWERQEPIPWVRLHQLPDHRIDCRHCHGEVREMAQLKRVASLKMGWCLNCHRDNQASIDCWTCHI